MRKVHKNSDDFINFGTYEATEADILKLELEKNGIPVKVLYPGTNVGRETLAQARWTAYKILIPASKVSTAQEICKRLNIKPRKKITLPKSLLLKILFIFFLAIIIGNIILLIILLIIPLF